MCSLTRTPHSNFHTSRALITKALFFAILSLSSIHILIVDFAYAESSKGNKPETIDEEKAPKKKSQTTFKVISKFKKDYERICLYLYFDGHNEKFFNALDAQSEKNDLCPACRPLLRELSRQCDGKRIEKILKKQLKGKKTKRLNKKGKGKEVEEKLPQPPKVRERAPHPELIDYMSRTFIEYGAAEDTSIEISKAVGKLVGILRSPVGMDEVEKEYFGILASYIEAPFLGDLQEKKGKDGSGKKIDPRNYSLDTLFD